MELRPYQKKLVEDARQSLLKGNKSIICVSGCGSGKSVTAADIAKKATDKGNKVLFMVHRKELCEQISGTFSFYGVDMSLCDIKMVQTMRRRYKKFGENYYSLIIIDECHTNLKAYKSICEYFKSAVKIGFTATPVRLGTGGLGELYTDIVTSATTKWLIEHKYLAPYKYYSIPFIDTKGLHIQAGDYKQDEVNELMENKAVYSGAVEQYKKFANGKKTMVYCSSISSSIETAKAFSESGIVAEHLDGTISKSEREEKIEKYRNGEIRVLCNVGLLNEGFDDKDIECVILLRPTLSLALFIQQSMRSMRYKEGKTAIILDCVCNVYKHGLPDDNREWSLEPKAVQETTVKIRECPNCYAVYPPTLSKCPYCGYEAVKEIRTVNRKTVDIDLVEVKRQEEVKNTKPKDADLRTWEEIVDFQKIHGYNFSWCVRYASNHGIDFPSKYAYSARKYQKIHRKSKINIDEL